MAFAGLRKQINKANQYVTEKMGGAEGTKLDLDFMEMERKTEVTCELVEELQAKTKEFLQPNPTARAKMAAVKGISKLSGQAKSNTYPQPEGLLADCMLLYGKKLGEDSIFAQTLIEMGDALRQMADVKYSLDDNVKQNFLEPLHHLQTKDLKEVSHHRKKLQGRRLDYDCKRRRQAKDDEIRSAEEKFAESLLLAQMGMYNLLENDVEQVSQITMFAEGLLDYHNQCTDILKLLVETLQEKRDEAANRPKSEFVPKTLTDLNIEGLSITDSGMMSNGGNNFTSDNGGNNFDGNFKRPSTRHPNSHLYSSQQNLAKGGLSISSTNNNFKRSDRLYGSQQSLSTASRSSSNSLRSGAPVQSTFNNNTNSDHQVDDWLNAWNSPPRANGNTSNNTNSNGSRYTGATSTNSFTNPTSNTYNRPVSKFSNNKFIANDPWTVNKPTHLELDNGQAQGARSTNASPLPSPMPSPARTPMAPPKQAGPHCVALYDFEPENPGELGFKENDIITLLNKVDENWYEGSVNGRTGYFPQSYVEVKVQLPN